MDRTLKCGFRHHFWVGATANPPKSDEIYAQLTRGAFIINDFLQNPHFRPNLIFGSYDLGVKIWDTNQTIPVGNLRSMEHLAP
jgi:hypothetical protein